MTKKVRRRRDARRRGSGARYLTATLAAALVALAAGPAVASAATLQVEEGGADSGDCVASPCATISYALGQASNGDTVGVAAGTYAVDSAIVVDKAVTIAGAQQGVDARNREVSAGAETTVTSTQNFSSGLIRLSAPGATVDGLTVKGHTQSGVQLMNSSSGYTVRNTILTDNEVGVDLETTAADPEPTLIERNRFEANNRVTLMSGIYGDSTASDVTIRDNRFLDHTNVPINVSGKSTFQEDWVISGNSFENERHLLLLAADGVEISGNVFSDGRSQAIAVQGGVSDLTISGNAISDSADAGILFGDYYGAGPNDTAAISGNTFLGTNQNELEDGGAIAVSNRVSGDPGYTGQLEVSGNRIAGNLGAGVRNEVAGASVDATGNWWGCNDGPGEIGCDGVAGVGSIDAGSHLQLSGIAGSASVVTGASTGVRASLGVPDGTPIRFASALGTIAPEWATTSGGHADSVFTAGTTLGNAGVTVALDNEEVPVGLTVVKPEPQPGPDPEPQPEPEPEPEPGDPRESAKDLLGGVAVRADRSFGIDSVDLFVPTRSADRKRPSRAVPIVTPNGKVTIHPRGARKGVAQRLLTVHSSEKSQRLVVTKRARVGKKSIRLPKQKTRVGPDKPVLVKVQIKKAMKRALLKGRKVSLQLRVRTVDDSGQADVGKKRFRLEAHKSKRKR